jgi:prevent-host-death family protein
VAPSRRVAVVTSDGYNMVMKTVGIADLKAHLSGHLRTVKKGETLIVVERGTPVARIVPAADLRGGVVTRPPTRDLTSVKRMLKRLPPLALPVDSLAILLEDRKR